MLFLDFGSSENFCSHRYVQKIKTIFHFRSPYHCPIQKIKSFDFLKINFYNNFDIRLKNKSDLLFRSFEIRPSDPHSNLTLYLALYPEF
jgi:hypothetical protein